MGAQSAPGGLQSVEHLVLGHGLVDPALKDLLSAAAVELDRLVPGEERHPGMLQLPLDGEVLVHAAGDAGGALADDGVEAPVGVGGLGEQVDDAAIPGDGNAEALEVRAPAALAELFAAGLDVVEVADDGPRLRQRGLAPLPLAQE
ncbi:hypothetical protein [Streptomyces sp. G45]|uniref:hypothetical protein n=1 Tax=Streptomyces sp. G45 TaxID=3406627 RepID=UPI003C290F7D